METQKTGSGMRKLLIQAVIIMGGLTVYALGVALFILPVDMIAAGTTGMALAAEHYWGIPLSGFVAVFNILMFILGWLELGREFALSTLIATFYYPFILDRMILLVGDNILTRDPMLCAIFSGLMIGVSLGVVIRAGASTGGLDIPPLVLKKRFGIPVSVTLYVVDFAVLLSQMTFGDKERILYGLIMVIVYTIVLDKVLLMGTRQMQVKIISDQFETISRLVQEKLDRGTTLLSIEGGHSRKKSFAVLVVVSGRELTRLNRLVMEQDDKAFMIVNQVGEVKGRGFTLTKKYE
ncbi:MAG: YitT family protein [Lachnospiraceae bacterium]|jgi:uncharacterized membrane-anchored protein YitT (DUF2179 family)|nr:YitT family protein [Lachnospiraceae bacterium]